MKFFTNGDPREPLPPLVQQRLDGWIAMLDVDIDLAQKMLRLPVHELPLPPIALAPVVRGGEVLVPAVEAAGPDETPPAPVKGLRGAYARRAARQATTR